MIGRIIDWIDLRVGIKEFHEKHIAFPLQEAVGFWSLFSGLIIGCIAILFVTGFYMLAYYIPEPVQAHQSIRDMCNNTSFGALFRNAHRWSATMGIFFLTVHAFHIIAKRSYRSPRELNWWLGLMLAFIFILSTITGIILPWDWRSYWELVIWADWLDTIPLVGDGLKNLMLSGFSLGRVFSFHIILLPALLLGVLALHIVIFRLLGMSDRV